MPYLISKYKGNKWNKNKHLETIIPALFRNIPIKYTRERLELDDGDFIDLDWKFKNNNKKLLILFHGLEGSSNSQYIKGFAKYFYQNNFNICAVNFRSCSGENNRLLSSYHMGKSEDIKLIIEYILNNKNYTSIVLGGFSLGGNVLLKYLGEQSFNLNKVITSAFAFSVPIELDSSSKVLSKNWNKPYMIRFLKTLNKKMITKSIQFPGIIDTKGINKINNFHEWDTRFTAKTNGFIDAKDYYNKSSSLQFLPQIKIPTLLINALNDPFLSEKCYPIELAKKHEFLYLETPKQGGHVGFLMNKINGIYYSEMRALEFVSGFIK